MNFTNSVTRNVIDVDFVLHIDSLIRLIVRHFGLISLLLLFVVIAVECYVTQFYRKINIPKRRICINAYINILNSKIMTCVLRVFQFIKVLKLLVTKVCN